LEISLKCDAFFCLFMVGKPVKIGYSPRYCYCGIQVLLPFSVSPTGKKANRVDTA
jgi:hypothetical protein